MKIRTATTDDAARIARIYNFYVEKSHCTFELEPIAEADMRGRIGEILAAYPFYVTEENGDVLGYAYAARYKLREAYRHSVETSIYIRHDAGGRGVGTVLYEKLLGDLKSFHAVIGGISLPNEPSVRLHEKFGFEKVAHFREVGFKFGRWIDVGYWEKING